MVLFGDRFADGEFSSDSSTEKPLGGGQAVRSERLAVALIRAVLIINHQLGFSTLTWQTPEELKQELEPLSTGGGLLGAFVRSSMVQTALDQPIAHLHPGLRPHHWPEGTVEALLAELDSPDLKANNKPTASARRRVLAHFQPPSSVATRLETKLGLHSGVGLLHRIKEQMAKRGLLERTQRGFGLLAAGFKLPESTRALAVAQLPALEDTLRAAQHDNPRTWDGLNETITAYLQQNN